MRSLIQRRFAASEMPREVWVLAAVAFSVALGFGIVAPVIPIFAREFGVGETAAGLVISAFAFMRLCFSPAGGWLVNRFGERVMMATGIGIVAVSSLLTGLAQNYEQMLSLRAAGGVGSVMFSVSAQSLLLRSVAPRMRGQASSKFYGGFLLGGLTGPVFGGILGGISLRLPFFIYAGTLALAGTIAMVFLHRSERMAEASSTSAVPVTTLRTALRDKAYQAALTVNAGTGWAIFGIRSSLVPLFVVEALHRGPLWVGIGLLVGSVVDVVLLQKTGKLADTVGRRPMLLGGTGLGAIGALMLALAPNLPMYLIGMAVIGAAASMLSVGPSAVVGDVVQGRGGTVVSTFGMASDLGAVVGPLAAGALAEHVGYGTAFTSTALVLMIGFAMALRMPETVHRSRPTADSAEGTPEVGEKVVDVLDADGKSHQI
ncbi:MFS transporter [Sporichthya polymorpha]|uniref:MFS transporter n=1 Tax=Sporichthya polymorpha TaxID=35751 RepID=UPI000364416B|nr:MFS transporter [Sporichthya polymorpha]